MNIMKIFRVFTWYISTVMGILFEGRLMLCVCVNKIYQIKLDKEKVIWIKSKSFLKNEQFNKDSKWLHIPVCNFSRMYIISLLWGKNAPFGPILPSNLFKCRIAIWHLYLFRVSSRKRYLHSWHCPGPRGFCQHEERGDLGSLVSQAQRGKPPSVTLIWMRLCGVYKECSPMPGTGGFNPNYFWTESKLPGEE